jgi:hypothetical protein
MLFIIYSCFTSGFFIVFEQPESQWHKTMNWVVFIMFLIDIFLSCCRQFRDIDGNLVESHKRILINYTKSGQIFFDILSTIPFELIQLDN